MRLLQCARSEAIKVGILATTHLSKGDGKAINLLMAFRPRRATPKLKAGARRRPSVTERRRTRPIFERFQN